MNSRSKITAAALGAGRLSSPAALERLCLPRCLMIGGTRPASGRAGPLVRVSVPQWLLHGVTVSAMAYPLSAAQTHLGELVTEARHSHRPITISEDGKPVAALIDIDDLADLEDRAALAAHLADKADGRAGISLDQLDAALDRIDAATSS
jgi:prevent-host-death family protein